MSINYKISLEISPLLVNKDQQIVPSGNLSLGVVLLSSGCAILILPETMGFQRGHPETRTMVEKWLDYTKTHTYFVEMLEGLTDENLSPTYM